MFKTGKTRRCGDDRCSQQQELLHKTWATSEHRRKGKHGKKHCLSHRVFVKQASGANHWEIA